MIVKLSDPHPGLAGCQFRLPGRLRIACLKYDGKLMELDKVVNSLNKLTSGLPGQWCVKSTGKCIVATQVDGEQENHWRLLQFIRSQRGCA